LIISRIADACLEGAHLRAQQDETEFAAAPAGDKPAMSLESVPAAS
jgi:small subunit ribosomal protein S2